MKAIYLLVFLMVTTAAVAVATAKLGHGLVGTYQISCAGATTHGGIQCITIDTRTGDIVAQETR